MSVYFQVLPIKSMLQWLWISIYFTNLKDTLRISIGISRVGISHLILMDILYFDEYFCVSINFL